MNEQQLRELFQKITCNGNREMTEERFIQAVNELLETIDWKNKKQDNCYPKCDLQRHSSCGMPCHWFNEENGNCEYEAR